MTLTPEQQAKLREEFQQLLLATNEWFLASFQSNGDKYYDWKLQAMFDGFLLRQQSFIVELPEAYVDYDEDYDLSRFYGKKEILSVFQSAGINYREKE